MKIAICGARGFLGSSLVRSSCSAGAEVVALARRFDVVPRRCVSFALDFSSTLAWKGLPRLELDCVVYAAGRAHVVHESPDSREQFGRSNVAGVRNALEFARRSGAKRFILASSISVYNFGSGKKVTEVDLCSPVSLYGQSKLAGEAVCQGVTDMEIVIVRLATLFGHGDVANFYRMCRAIRSGRFFIPGSPDAQKSVLPVDLATEIILRFAEQGTRGYSLFNVALPVAPTLREVCDVFEEVCGFGRVRNLGRVASVAAGWAGDLASLVWRGCPFNSAVRRKISQSTVVSTERLYSNMQGLNPRSFLDWMQDYADYYRLK